MTETTKQMESINTTVRINRRKVFAARKEKTPTTPTLEIPKITITPCESNEKTCTTLLQKRKRRDSFYLDEEILVKRVRNNLSML